MTRQKSLFVQHHLYTRQFKVHRDMIQSNTLKLCGMVYFPGVGKDSGSRILDERQLLDDFFKF